MAVSSPNPVADYIKGYDFAPLFNYLAPIDLRNCLIASKDLKNKVEVYVAEKFFLTANSFKNLSPEELDEKMLARQIFFIKMVKPQIDRIDLTNFPLGGGELDGLIGHGGFSQIHVGFYPKDPSRETDRQRVYESEHMSQILTENKETLKGLDLSFFHFDSDGFFEEIFECQQLERLSLRHVSFKGDRFFFLTEDKISALFDLPNLTQLDLGMEIIPQGGTIEVSRLSSVKQLTLTNFIFNKLGDFSAMLPDNLQELSVSNLKFDNTPTQEEIDSFPKSVKNLQKLRLEFNSVGLFQAFPELLYQAISHPGLNELELEIPLVMDQSHLQFFQNMNQIKRICLKTSFISHQLIEGLKELPSNPEVIFEQTGKHFN